MIRGKLINLYKTRGIVFQKIFQKKISLKKKEILSRFLILAANILPHHDPVFKIPA